jgi:transcriptional regulator with XRE-family HTH domain
VLLNTDSEEAKAFAARLGDACRMAQLPSQGSGRQTILAEALGVSQQAVSKWLRAKGKPHRDRVQDIASFLGVSARWLDTGQGAPGDGAPQEGYEELSHQERLVVRLMRSMPPSRRDDLVDVAELWAKRH